MKRYKSKRRLNKKNYRGSYRRSYRKSKRKNKKTSKRRLRGGMDQARAKARADVASIRAAERLPAAIARRSAREYAEAKAAAAADRERLQAQQDSEEKRRQLFKERFPRKSPHKKFTQKVISNRAGLSAGERALVSAAEKSTRFKINIEGMPASLRISEALGSIELLDEHDKLISKYNIVQILGWSYDLYSFKFTPSGAEEIVVETADGENIAGVVRRIASRKAGRQQVKELRTAQEEAQRAHPVSQGQETVMAMPVTAGAAPAIRIFRPDGTVVVHAGTVVHARPA